MSHWKAPFGEVACTHDSPVILRGKRFQLKERLRAGVCKSMRKKDICGEAVED